jgi:hypothetical protein
MKVAEVQNGIFFMPWAVWTDDTIDEKPNDSDALVVM